MQNRMMSGHKQYMSAIRKKACASALILKFTSEVFAKKVQIKCLNLIFFEGFGLEII